MRGVSRSKANVGNRISCAELLLAMTWTTLCASRAREVRVCIGPFKIEGNTYGMMVTTVSRWNFPNSRRDYWLEGENFSRVENASDHEKACSHKQQFIVEYERHEHGDFTLKDAVRRTWGLVDLLCGREFSLRHKQPVLYTASEHELLAWMSECEGTKSGDGLSVRVERAMASRLTAPQLHNHLIPRVCSMKTILRQYRPKLGPYSRRRTQRRQKCDLPVVSTLAVNGTADEEDQGITADSQWWFHPISASKHFPIPSDRAHLLASDNLVVARVPLTYLTRLGWTPIPENWPLPSKALERAKYSPPRQTGSPIGACSESDPSMLPPKEDSLPRDRMVNKILSAPASGDHAKSQTGRRCKPANGLRQNPFSDVSRSPATKSKSYPSGSRDKILIAVDAARKRQPIFGSPAQHQSVGVQQLIQVSTRPLNVHPVRKAIERRVPAKVSIFLKKLSGSAEGRLQRRLDVRKTGRPPLQGRPFLRSRTSVQGQASLFKASCLPLSPEQLRPSMGLAGRELAVDRGAGGGSAQAEIQRPALPISSLRLSQQTGQGSQAGLGQNQPRPPLTANVHLKAEAVAQIPDLLHQVDPSSRSDVPKRRAVHQGTTRLKASGRGTGKDTMLTNDREALGLKPAEPTLHHTGADDADALRQLVISWLDFAQSQHITEATWEKFAKSSA